MSPCPHCGYNGSGHCQQWLCPRKSNISNKPKPKPEDFPIDIPIPPAF